MSKTESPLYFGAHFLALHETMFMSSVKANISNTTFI